MHSTIEQGAATEDHKRQQRFYLISGETMLQYEKILQGAFTVFVLQFCLKIV